MKAIRTKMSGVEVLIQAEDDIIEIDPPKTSGEPTSIPTISGEPMGIDIGNTLRNVGSSKRKASETVENVSNVIFAFAEDCKKLFDSYDNAPNEIEIEYSLSLSLEAKAWTFVSAGTKAAINVRMKWEKKEPKATP